MQEMKLLDVCDFRGGTQPPKEEWVNEKQDGYVRMLQIRDFTQGNEKFIQYVLDTKKLRKCTKDDLLLSRYGYIGQVVTGLEGAYNVALVKIEQKIEINRLYLKYYFQSEYFKNYLLSNTGARATIAGFNKSELKDAIIRVPSDDIQQKIVDRLAQVDELIKKRTEQIDAFNQLIKGRFKEMFDDGGETLTVQDLCTDIVDCPHSTPSYEGELIYPSIRTTDIKDGFIDWTQMKYVSEKEYKKRIGRITPVPGDIVYGREGTYGNATILPEGYQFCLGQRVMLFRADISKCIPEYLLHCLISDDVRRQADAKNVGSTVPHVNVADAKKFTVKLHPMQAQIQFAQFAQQVSGSRTIAETALTELQTLKQSLLKEIFG